MQKLAADEYLADAKTSHQFHDKRKALVSPSSGEPTWNLLIRHRDNNKRSLPSARAWTGARKHLQERRVRRTHSLTHTPPHSPPPHTHSHTHARTHARARTHTHTHTHARTHAHTPPAPPPLTISIPTALSGVHPTSFIHLLVFFNYFCFVLLFFCFLFFCSPKLRIFSGLFHPLLFFFSLCARCL